MKQLNTNGSKIESYTIELRDFVGGNPSDEVTYQKLCLTIIIDEPSYGHNVYSYEIFDDLRFTVENLETVLAERIDVARKEFLKIEISEWSERRYLTINIKKKGYQSMQVTGIRLGR